jgi:Na+-transporting NADH:ubiquinone oxidoreductase subunit NqrD
VPADIGADTDTAHVVHLSDTSAKRQLLSPLQAGLQDTAAIAGVAAALPFVTRHTENGVLGIAFTLDATNRTQLIQALVRVPQRAVA